MCHIFLVLPILGLPLFFILPWGEALPLYAGICLLSAAFYWLIWRTRRRHTATGIEGMIGGHRYGISMQRRENEGVLSR